MGAELVRDRDRRQAWTLVIGGIPHSYVDLDDPCHLEFEYIRRLGHVLDRAAPAGERLRVLHLGAGALTLARYVAATRPGSAQLAVDNDAGLVDLVRADLPAAQAGPGRGRVRVRIGDAREVLERLRPRSFDVVIADVFTGGQTPASLTSAEFTVAAERVLHADGILAANVADGPPLSHARSQAATVRTTFRHTCLIGDPGVLRGRRFGNLVLIASHHELPVAALTRLTAADPMPGRVLDDAAMVRFAAGARPVTDATARPSPAPPADLFARRG
jgi:spermidine synthase